MKNEKTVTIKTTNTELFNIAFNSAITRTSTRYFVLRKTRGNVDPEEIIKLHMMLSNNEDITTDKIISTFGLIKFLSTTEGSKCLNEGDSITYSVRNHDRILINVTIDGKMTQFTYRIIFIQLSDITDRFTLGDIATNDKEFINALQLKCLIHFGSKRTIIK